MCLDLVFFTKSVLIKKFMSKAIAGINGFNRNVRTSTICRWDWECPKKIRLNVPRFNRHVWRDCCKSRTRKKFFRSVARCYLCLPHLKTGVMECMYEYVISVICFRPKNYNYFPSKVTNMRNFATDSNQNFFLNWIYFGK